MSETAMENLNPITGLIMTVDTSQPLNPISRQRNDFREGTEVKLRDGNLWTFPAPYVQFGRIKREDGTRGLGSWVSFPTAYREMLDRVDRANDDEDFQTSLLLQIELAGMLLRQNYNIDDDEVDQLIRFAFDEAEPELREMTQSIQLLIRGQQPRPKEDTASGEEAA